MIIHCPHCGSGAPVMKDVELMGSGPVILKLLIKCPNCRHPLNIKIEARLTTQVTINGIEIERVGAAQVEEDSHVRTL